MNKVVRSLIERRCVRKFKPDQVKDEHLQDIVLAGTYAPSGQGKQPATIVVVQDPETRNKLEDLNRQIIGNPDANPFYGAPTVIVVLTDPENSGTAFEDGVLVMGNMMNAAHAVGVDACWIHRAKQTFELPEGKELLKKWGLKESLVGIGNCILGYRDCDYPAAKPRKEDYVVYIK
ncbi:MAG: nitroreductase [Lachnospiraceae bacterium]|jgi:nitroreductase